MPHWVISNNSDFTSHDGVCIYLDLKLFSTMIHLRDLGKVWLTGRDPLLKLQVCARRVGGACGSSEDQGLGFTPKALRTHNIRLLGPKTILYKAFGLF